MPQKLKYILIINPFGIGDVLFSTALIEAIGRQVEGCHIGFLCNRRTEALLKNNPLIDWIFVFEKDEFRSLWKESKVKCVKEFMSLLKEIRGKRFDTVFDLSLSRQFGFFMWAIGIPRRIGFNYKNRGIFLTDKIDIEGYHDKHIVECYLNLLELVGFKPTTNYLMLYVSDADKKWAKDFLTASEIKEGDLVVGMVPGGGASWGKDAGIKHWKREKFAQAADQLIEKYHAKIIILGDETESDICDGVRKSMRNIPVMACGLTTLLQFAALMGMCNLVIANDGGPLHVAVVMGAKTVGIFGPVDEKVYGQYPSSEKHKVVKSNLKCQPCYKYFKLKDCDTRRCLDEVAVEDVLKAAEEVLGFK
ncbi:MAG: hypothetical protein AMJ78_01840 [Omnitrophica WOR_2 bacterium SM23_29]|nr:MAG: hypothetical protein AMJ78_01840 [Omnitrophica WOR_2 bacterium SM23_29]